MTDDILDLVYNILKNDEIIPNYVTSQEDGLKIRYFTYPETADMSGSWVVLEPILNEIPSVYADDVWLAYEYLLHVEVWSRDREDNRLIASRIRDILSKELRFTQDDGIDEYDLGIYRDARRYTGKLYRSDFESLI